MLDADDGRHLAPPLPGLWGRGRLLSPPITVGEHIGAKLRGSRGLEGHTAGTEREAERVTAPGG